jgi:hypothetical protein
MVAGGILSIHWVYFQSEGTEIAPQSAAMTMRNELPNLWLFLTWRSWDVHLAQVVSIALEILVREAHVSELKGPQLLG